MTAYFEREKAKMVTLSVTQANSREEGSSSVIRKEVESSAEFVELARGIEPSNRRRVGPETCLTGSCEGASPLARSPRRGHIPFEAPRLEVQLCGAGERN